MTKTEIQSKTAKLAYFYFLERMEKGLPGDEANDWVKAEEAMQKELSKEEIARISTAYHAWRGEPDAGA